MSRYQRILGDLCGGSGSAGDVAVATGMDQSACSRQLRVLRELGLVVGQRHGHRIVYALHNPHLCELLRPAVGQPSQRVAVTYAVIIERTDEGCYGAWCPDLPGCVATGATESEALAHMNTAIQAHIELLRDKGLPIPRSTAVAAATITVGFSTA